MDARFCGYNTFFKGPLKTGKSWHAMIRSFQLVLFNLSDNMYWMVSCNRKDGESWGLFVEMWKRGNFANRRSKIFAWTKFRESACFSPYIFHFPGGFGENCNFENFAWTKFRENGQNSRESRKLIHGKINPLKVLMSSGVFLECSRVQGTWNFVRDKYSVVEIERYYCRIQYRCFRL